MRWTSLLCRRPTASRRCCRRCSVWSAAIAIVFAILATHELLLSSVNLFDGALSLEDVKAASCPACFGQEFCVRLPRFRREPEVGTLIIGNGKGVHFGRLIGEHWSNAASTSTGLPETSASPMLVAKSLAFDSELEAVNRLLCLDAKSSGVFSGSCDGDLTDKDIAALVMDVAKRLASNRIALYNVSSDAPSVTACVGKRLHEKFVQAYDGNSNGRLLPKEAAILRTTLLVNTEAVVLKAFPSSEGWPFPKYYGACGRMIFVEYGGDDMSDYLNQPWTLRVQIAKALVDMVIQLTENTQQWIFHMLDLQLENFAVRFDSKSGGYLVKLIDLEHLLIVHRRDPVFSGEVQPAGVEPAVDVEAIACARQPSQCQVVYAPQLCAGGHQDSNYFFVCRNLLFADLSWSGDRITAWTGGLLKNPIVDSEARVSLTHLLNECISNKKGIGRRRAFYQLSHLLARFKEKSP